ncbi:APC family permease [Microbacterium sp. 18062]|uniref:APC family permease n=1 Tax=Microbacterium sp. 18062 TaxID=2681410 RepID=UPI001357D5A8|nr:APC family permease [Microbacterium sp. 18062]
MVSTNPDVRPGSSTALKKDAIGVVGILFFVLSAQAPLTSVVGVGAVAIMLGNGPGFPSAYLVVGAVMLVFAVGFTTITRHVSNHGGFSVLVDAGLGRRAGVGAAFLALLSYSVIQAALYGLFGAATSGLVAAYVGISIPWWALSLAAVVFVLLLGARNVELGARVLAVLVAGEFLILLLFALVVIFGGHTAEGIDVAASFSPAAVVQGAPGIAIMFAVACMFGFESTTIYASEAKNPARTVPRATYAAVVIIAGFLALAIWSLILYYGPSQVQAAAIAAIESGDSALFVTDALDDILGPWAGATAGVLLLTSLLAALLAFHNVINRYLHASSARGFLPVGLQRTNRHHAPATAGRVQTLLAVLVIAPFALLGLDPIVTLFGWFSGLAVAALIALYVVTSLAVIVYFRRTRADRRLWNTLVAPVLAVVLLLGQLGLIVSNFSVLSGGDVLTSVLLLGAVPTVFVAGWIVAMRTETAAASVRTGLAPTETVRTVSARQATRAVRRQEPGPDDLP